MHHTVYSLLIGHRHVDLESLPMTDKEGHEIMTIETDWESHETI